jgi:hypothetical protein
MCDTCGWDEFAQSIDALIADGSADWASDTLEGISENVMAKEHVTVGQFNAVQNIKHAAERRGDARGQGRRR